VAASISAFTLHVDYGYAPFKNLGGVHRISLVGQL
jgi:hypothetical protein